MNWRELYFSRTVTAKEAISHIKSGDRVALGHACAEPLYLVDTMVNNCDAYENVELVQMVPMGNNRYLEPGMEKHFHLNSIFAGAVVREAIEDGRADFTPCSFARVPRMFHSFLPVDVALVSVTPPDRYGNCSLGVSVDYTKTIIQEAKLVIAQVNDQMPYTYGDSRIPVSKIDYFVEHSAPLPELKPHYIGETESRIGEYCASLIQDGDTLQLGIGAIPDAVLQMALQHHLPRPVQGRFGRVDLGKNVLAGYVFVHHAVDGLHLADDLFQAAVQIRRIHTLLHKIRALLSPQQ